MASIKALLYIHKTLKNGEHPIIIQIIKDRKRKTISFNQSCSKKHWDFKEGLPKKSHPSFSELSILIEKKKLEARNLLLSLQIDKKDFSLDEFQKKFKNTKKSITVLKFIDSIIENLIKIDKIGNANTYRDCKREITKFRNGIDLTFSDIDQSFLRRYEQTLRERKLKETSISVYFRTLRSVYNKAIKDGYAKKSDYPFDDFKISKFNTDTQRRAIPIDEIKRIQEFEAKDGSSILHSKNYFLFSFFTMGMNFSDLAKMKWTNISQGRLSYIRSKTGKHYSIKLLPPALKILSYYKAIRVDGYVFPILNESVHQNAISIDNRIEKMNKITNADLKEIANKVDIETNLTTYVARHSWATILKKSGVSVSIISEGLGHDTEETTKVYLDSFDSETMDKANEVLLSL